jgi:membrane-associated protein
MLVAFSPFAWLTDLVSDEWWTYLLVFGAVVFDADLPLIPGEAVIVTAAIAAHEGGLSVWLVGLSAAAGGIVGDNVSYVLGEKGGQRAYDRLFSGKKSQERFEWAKERLERHGSWVIPAARFVPGGRTGVTFAAGTTEVTWPRFAIADAAAAGMWAIYATALGYFGGAAFESSWKAFLLAFGIGATVGLAGFGFYKIAESHS